MQNSGALVVIDIPQRRKRICRGLNLTSPPDFVLDQFSRGLTDCRTEWESQGYVELKPEAQSRSVAGKQSHSAGIKPKLPSVPDANQKTAEALLKKKRRRMYIQEPPFLTPDVEAIIPCVSSVLSSAFRCNANHVAVGRVQKDGSSVWHLQQTTRVPIGGPVVASAVQQMNNRIVVGLAAGMAARSCTDKVTIARPECTFHPSPKEAVEWVRECKDGSENLIWAMHCRHIAGVAPRSLNPGDLLATMIEIARKELHEHLISAVVPQSTRHLEMVCTYICKAKDGSRVWFCLQLLVWMVSGDFRMHSILENHGITDFDYANALTLVIYAASLVTNRARQNVDLLKKLVENMTSDGLHSVDEVEKMQEAWTDMGEWTSTVATSDINMSLDNMALIGQAHNNKVCARSKTQRVNGGTSTAGRSYARSGVSGKGSVDPPLEKDNEAVSNAMVVADDQESSAPTAEEESESGSKRDRKRRSPKSLTLSGANRIRDFELFLCHFQLAKACDYMEDSESASAVPMPNCSLTHFVSDRADASASRAQAILQWQMKNTGLTDELLSHMSMAEDLKNASTEAALHTRKLIMSLLKNDESSCPVLSRWSVFNRTYVGLGHRPTGGTLYALTAKPPAVLQSEDESSCVMWCKSFMKAKDTCKTNDSVPPDAAVGLIEALSEVDDGEPKHSYNTKNNAKKLRLFSWLNMDVSSSTATGMTRSVFVLKATIPIGTQTFHAIKSVCNEIINMKDVDAENKNERNLGEMLVESECSLSTRTPVCLPANPFVVGFNISEGIRFSYANIAKEQAMCLVSFTTGSKVPPRVPKLINPNHRPWAMLHVVDINFDPVYYEGCESGLEKRASQTSCNTPTFLDGGRTVLETDVNVSISVCADSPIPVTKAVACIAEEAARQHRSLDFVERHGADGCHRGVFQLRAVLFMAGVQCHTVNTFGNACASRNTNTSIENTSRVVDPDNHRLLNSTVYQAYVSGNSNVEPQFHGTVWHGAYGSVFDCGTVASVGQRAKNIVSDDRLPVRPLVIDQDQFADMSRRFSHFTFTRVVSSKWDYKKRFAKVPEECWGLPRYLIAGMHTALASLCDAYTFLRKASGTENNDTVMSIQVLPFSPFTEAVPPLFKNARWNSFRRDTVSPSIPMHSSTHQPDATLPEASVMNTTLLDGCRVQDTQTIDNIFENCNTNVSVVLLVASIVDTVARTILQLEGGEIRNDSYTTERAMQSLYSVLEEVHSDEHVRLPRWKSVLAFDALVLFNVLAPQTFGISEYVVLRAYSIAPGAVAQNDAVRRLRDVPGISHQDISEALEYWSRLKRRGDSHSFWDSTVDLVCCVRRCGTTFSNSISDMRRVAGTLEKWVRSIWHLHSPDGASPPGMWSPLHCCKHPSLMRSLDVVGVYVDRDKVPQMNRKVQRGALFGIDYSALNQVLCLLNASRLPDVIVNYARNEGSICLRTSCNALKTDTNGNKPSMKSTSATYDDNDFEASGDREAREESARRQTEAWRKNNELLFEMTKYSHYKEDYSGSMRGSINSKLQREQNETEMQDKRTGSIHSSSSHFQKMRDAAKYIRRRREQGLEQ